VWSWWCVFLVCRSCMMNTILSKMVSGLTSTATLSHSTQPTDFPLGSQAAAQQSPLESCFCSIHRNGCVDSDAVHRLDTLLTATGPVCYTDQLVHVCWWWCFLWQFSISMLLCCTAVCRPLMYSNVNSSYRWTVLGLDVWVCFCVFTTAGLFFLALVFCVLCISSLLLFGCQHQCNWLPGKTRLWNDLIYVEWDVRPYTVHTHSLTV